MENENNNYNFFFLLSVLANLAQIASFDMNVRETKNDEIMQELQNQSKVLEEQTNIYLKKIVEQNEEILKLLKSGSIAK